MRGTYRKTLHIDIAQACKDYGKIARIGPNDLITNDPSIIMRMSAARSPYRRSQWYAATAIDHGQNHIFSEIDEAKHTEHRKKMNYGYSGKENPELESTVDSCLNLFFKLIREKYTSGRGVDRQVDFARIAQYLGIDVVAAIALGEPYGFLEQDDDVHDYIKTQMALLPVFEVLGTFPYLDSIVRIPWISKHAMPKPTDNHGMGRIIGMAQKRVHDRFTNPSEKGKRDMLGSWIAHGLNEREAATDLVINIVAGSDTIVTALRTTVMYVITHPTVYTKLQHELSSCQATRPIIRESEAKSLPYLNAVIKECMRVHPPVTGFMTKLTPPEGDWLDGKFVPGGTNIMYAAWDFYKDPAVWGADVEVFRPERWIEASPEQRAVMDQTIGLIFGYGRYGCLGKYISELELYKSLAEIFLRYDIALVDPNKRWDSYNRNGFFFQSNMWVRISERE